MGAWLGVYEGEGEGLRALEAYPADMGVLGVVANGGEKVSSEGV